MTARRVTRLGNAALLLLVTLGVGILLAPTAVASGPSVRGLTSASHPDQTIWYSNGAPVVTWGASAWTLRLTSNTREDYMPQVSGDRVVWTRYYGSGNDSEIFTWTPAGGVVRLTDNSSVDWAPRVSGNRIVWQQGLGSASEIYTWKPFNPLLMTGGLERLTHNGIADQGPEVSGSRIVWQRGDGGGSEIYTWTPPNLLLMTGGVEPLTENTTADGAPSVSDGRVAWQHDDGNDDEILTWTKAEGVEPCSDNATDDTYARVSGDRVVWRYDDGEETQVCTWTPSDGRTQITDSTSFHDDIDVSGDRVVWTDSPWGDVGIGPSGVGTWTPGGFENLFEGVPEGAEQHYSPAVSGDRVVWFCSQGDGQRIIYSWTPAGAKRLSSSAVFAYLPEVSGDRVVWEGNVGSDISSRAEIYTWTRHAWGFSYALDHNPSTVPDTSSEGAATTKGYSLADGTWYFHVRAGASANAWGATKTYRINIDTHRPRTKAPYAASVARGSTATLYYRVNDPLPNGGKARVTIRIKDLAGVTVQTLHLGLRPVNRLLSCSFLCTLPRATYEYFVYARDLAANQQSVLGHNQVTVH